MEPEFEKRYQSQMEEEGWKHQEMITKLVEDTNMLLDTKKDKVAHCKVLIGKPLKHPFNALSRYLFITSHVILTPLL
jgi:hypothetical protein